MVLQITTVSAASWRIGLPSPLFVEKVPNPASTVREADLESRAKRFADDRRSVERPNISGLGSFEDRQFLDGLAALME